MVEFEWFEDKVKDGERFSNSVCFTYCLKCFESEKRVEIWTNMKGYSKILPTKGEALFEYRQIKRLSRQEILGYVRSHYEEIVKKHF
jgi:hypothetical protein